MIKDQSAGSAVRSTAATLRAAGLDTAPRDARALVAHAIGILPDRLTLEAERFLDDDARRRLEQMIAARLERRPVSQIIGKRLFYGREFKVTPDVLDPRPETETLIEVALEQEFSKLLDLGTGSGAILLTLLAERVEAFGIGVDNSPKALAVASENATRLGVAKRAKLQQSDWFETVSGSFDLIVANPPYISASEMALLEPELAYEPRGALTDDADGLTAYRAIFDQVFSYLEPNGRLLVEIGWEQGPDVRDMALAAGFEAVSMHLDLDGRNRVVSCRKSG